MASRRSEERDRAYELWRASGGTMKLVDIANELSVTASKVRKWKTLDQWSLIGKTLPYENNTSDGIILSKGRGAPLGNKNSVGHKSSSPQKNANAVTTGEYQTIWEDAISDEEKAILRSTDTNPFTVIDETIRLLTLRERRMLIYLNELNAAQELCETKDIFELQSKPMIANVYDEITGEVSEIEVLQEQKTMIGKVEKRQPLIDRILSIEEALTRVQERKIRAIETKSRMMMRWEEARRKARRPRRQ